MLNKQTHVLFFVQSFQSYGFDRSRGTLSVTITAAASRSEPSKGAPSATPCVFHEAASVTLLDGRSRLQTPRGVERSRDVPWSDTPLLVRCITKHDACPIAEVEALKLSNLANKGTSIVRCNSSFVAIVKLVIIFSASFEKAHCGSFLAAQMNNIVEDMFSFNFLSGNSIQTYQHHIRVAKSFLQRSNIVNIIENIGAEETGSRTLSISHLNDGSLFSSSTEEGLLLSRVASQYVRNQTKHNPFYAPCLYKIEMGLLSKFHSPCQERSATSVPTIFAFLRAASSANETTAASTEQIFIITMRLHEHGPREKLEKRRARNERRR